ncbi:MAG: 4Fe-4S dicluster domain-containing protein, partial [Planctomycetes bacterium]|nr:4Fe-4S dicluster domain-containing protein [Planctomycetota bacterium]
PLSRCMTCGWCVEACPQFNDASPFIGPAAISQVVFFNAHATGRVDRDDRLALLTGRGGIADCGNSQNCVKVCPKDIPLTDSIAKAGREATLYKIEQWFGG